MPSTNLNSFRTISTPADGPVSDTLNNEIDFSHYDWSEISLEDISDGSISDGDDKIPRLVNEIEAMTISEEGLENSADESTENNDAIIHTEINDPQRDKIDQGIKCDLVKIKTIFIPFVTKYRNIFLFYYS